MPLKEMSSLDAQFAEVGFRVEGLGFRFRVDGPMLDSSGSGFTACSEGT